MDSQSLLIPGCVGLLIYTVIYLITPRARGRVPPGPTSWPIIGSLPALGFTLDFACINRLSKKYGDMFTVYLGSKTLIVLNDVEVIREALVKNGHAFSGRPTPVADVVSNGHGFLALNGLKWQQERKVVNRAFREYGMFQSAQQDAILSEVERAIAHFKTTEGKPTDPHSIFSQMAANVIIKATLDKRFEYNEDQFLWLVDKTQEFVRFQPKIGIVTSYPFLRALPDRFFKFDVLAQSMADARAFYSPYVKEHIEHMKDHMDDPPRDLLDLYIKFNMEIRENDDEILPILEQFMHGMIIAGQATTAFTLCWLTIYMAENPDVLQKIHEEMDSVVGSDRLPRLEDKPNLPYTEACILETQRFADISPLSLLRCVEQDVKIRGYDITKGTYIIPYLGGVHRDPKIWEKPEEYYPGHFFKDGAVDRRRDLIVYSVGKRSCGGEPLARMEVFLAAASFLHQFKFVQTSECTQEYKEKVGFLRGPDKFTVSFQARF